MNQWDICYSRPQITSAIDILLGRKTSSRPQGNQLFITTKLDSLAYVKFS